MEWLMRIIIPKPNPSFQLFACKRRFVCFRVPSSPRSSAAAELKR